ncbi:MAG: Clp1/GlmU family protein [Candidatus Tectimicrobiota bacterium]
MAHPTVEEAWPALLDAVQAARVVLFLGDVDVGKSTCIGRLADRVSREGGKVAIVDADVGQSDIGPPTAIGLGAVEPAEPGSPAITPLELYFVGSTSPQGHMLPLVVGTSKLVQSARLQGYAPILVDTTGLVRGQPGRVLKQHKIDLIEPDLVICLQRRDECEPVLVPYAAAGSPRLVRLRPDPQWAPKSPERRRAHRNQAFAAYFRDAPTERLPLADLVIENGPVFRGRSLGRRQWDTIETLLGEPLLWGELRAGELVVVVPRGLSPYERSQLVDRLGVRGVQAFEERHFTDVIVGLNDGERRTRGLGILRSIDVDECTMSLTTPVAPAMVRSMVLSRYSWRGEEV